MNKLLDECSKWIQGHAHLGGITSHKKAMELVGRITLAQQKIKQWAVKPYPVLNGVMFALYEPNEAGGGALINLFADKADADTVAQAHNRGL